MMIIVDICCGQASQISHEASSVECGLAARCSDVMVSQTATDPRPTLMNERTLSGSQYRKQQLTVDRKVSSMYCCNGDDIMMVIMMVIMMTT